MARLPRLPPPTEHRALRAICRLPPAALRLLFGPPITSDGQTLAADVQATLRLAKLGGVEDLYAGRPAAAARAETRREAAVAAGPRPPRVARAEDRTIPGPAGPIPIRLYFPLASPSLYFPLASPGDAPQPATAQPPAAAAPQPTSAPAADSPPPLLVFFHGGGWCIGDLDTHDAICRFFAATAGVAVLSVDYRLAPEHPFPAAVEDASAAFAWAAANAAALGVDGERIAVGGDSAGGNLAAVVSLLAREGGGPAPALQLLLYPVTDVEGKMRSRRTYARGFLLTEADSAAFRESYLPGGVDPAEPRVSVLGAGDLSDLPPAYVVTAGFDPLRDEGEAYAERMRAAGTPVALRRHQGLIHSFANQFAFSPSALAAMSETAGALRMGLAGKGAGAAGRAAKEARAA